MLNIFYYTMIFLKIYDEELVIHDEDFFLEIHDEYFFIYNIKTYVQGEHFLEKLLKYAF